MTTIAAEVQFYRNAHAVLTTLTQALPKQVPEKLKDLAQRVDTMAIHALASCSPVIDAPTLIEQLKALRFAPIKCSRPRELFSDLMFSLEKAFYNERESGEAVHVPAWKLNPEEREFATHLLCIMDVIWQVFHHPRQDILMANLAAALSTQASATSAAAAAAAGAGAPGE